MSKSDDLGMSQGVTHIDCKAGQTSSKSNIDTNTEVVKQSTLSYMYSNKVYSCSHCLMSICGENTTSALLCVGDKTGSSAVALISTDTSLFLFHAHSRDNYGMPCPNGMLFH